MYSTYRSRERLFLSVMRVIYGISWLSVIFCWSVFVAHMNHCTEFHPIQSYNPSTFVKVILELVQNKINMNLCTKFPQNLSIFVKVMVLRSSTNQVPAELLMRHGFRSLSNSSEILAICTHFPRWVEIHRDLFELLRGRQIINGPMDGRMPRHHLSSPGHSK